MTLFRRGVVLAALAACTALSFLGAAARANEADHDRSLQARSNDNTPLFSANEERSQSGRASKTVSQDTYKLGPLDKIRIKVYSWRASLDQIFDWTAINLATDYMVGPSGAVSVPLIGEIQAGGLTTSAFADAVSVALRDRIGMVETPDVAVEIAEYRPFYVTGDVEKAGEYPYRPGLTVMKAAAIAGGQMRDPRSNNLRLEREIITAEGDLTLLLTERTSLLIRRARLQSELNGFKEIALTDELTLRKDEPDVRGLLAQEEQIFRARLDGYTTQLSALEQLKSFYRTEIDSLTGQVEAQQREVDAVDKQVASVRELAAKRLTTSTRQLDLERNRAQVEGERLRLQSNLMRVKQDISRTEIDVIELRNKRTAEVTSEFATTESRLEQLEGKIVTTRKLLAESEVIGAPPLLGLSLQKYTISYKIVRDGPTEFYTDEATSMEPGDTLKVEIVKEGGNLTIGTVQSTPPIVGP